MKQEELQVIKERVAKATEGPWHRMFKVGIEIHAENEWAPVISEDEGVALYSDADFIIHARQDVPELIAEVERLREALEKIAYTPTFERLCDVEKYAADILEGE